MTYSITFAQLPIVGGTAGHNYIVLTSSDGTVLKEMNGLATNAQGARIPVGTSNTDMLKVYEDTGRYFYTPTSPQQVVFSGTEAQAMALWKRAQDAMSIINSMNLPYPPWGFNIFSPTINSNSVATTLLSVMGLTEPHLSNMLTPGSGNTILTQSQLESIRNANPLPGSGNGGEGGSGGGDNDGGGDEGDGNGDHNPPPQGDTPPDYWTVANKEMTLVSESETETVWQWVEYNAYGDVIGQGTEIGPGRPQDPKPLPDNPTANSAVNPGLEDQGIESESTATEANQAETLSLGGGVPLNVPTMNGIDTMAQRLVQALATGGAMTPPGTLGLVGPSNDQQYLMAVGQSL
ncbi:MAG: hypothetical protein J0L58_08555 [Burkholderiales bacterium]|uniref:hypothetical protein n=1 Tax=Inhella sp. TaxID=1921806 RepID=UPI001AC7AF39|nr:hypothetical protein [Burkholderiales bacterium]